MSAADSHPGGNSTLDALIEALRPLLRKVRTTDSAIKVVKPNGKKQAIWTTERLTPELMLKHLNGGQPRGVCPMQYGSDVTMVGLFDIDDHDKSLPWSTLLEVGLKLMEVMRSYGLVPIPFRSSSGHGIHIYCVWADPQDAYSVRALMKHILLQMGFTSGTGGVQTRQIEIFPKADRMREQRVRINTKTGKRSVNRGSQFFLPLADKSVPLDPRTLADLPKVPSSISWPDSAPVKKLEKPERVRSSDEPCVELATLQSALAAIPDEAPEMVEYGDWIKMLAAIHYETEGSAEGLELAHEFSSRASNYDASVLDDKWDTFGDDCDTPVTGGSIIHVARGYGWNEFDVNTGFDDESAPPQQPEVDTAWPDIQLPGVAGMLATYIEASSPQLIPQFAAAAALSVIAALTAGRYLVKGTITPLNLYMVLLADTGTGKDYYLRIPATLVKQLGVNTGTGFAAGVSSGQGLTRRLSKRRALMLTLDEVGHLLAAAGMKENPNGASLVAEMLSLFSMGAHVYTGRIYADEKKDIPEINAPFLHMLGATTPAKLWNVMKDEHVQEGLLNRVLLLQSGPAPDNLLRVTNMPPQLRDALIRIAAPFDDKEEYQVGDVILSLWPIEDEAVAAYRDIREMQKDRGPLWSRAAENTMRIAGLLAVADQRPIATSDIATGRRLVEWSISLTNRGVQENSYESENDRVCKQIMALVNRGQTNIEKWAKYCRPGQVPLAYVRHQLQRVPNHVFSGAISTLTGSEQLLLGPVGKVKKMLRRL